MLFYDEVKIHIESGKWWNGLASGRREAMVAFGWPSWWDGWTGGDIIFVASKDENTLLPYRYQKNFKAQSGEDGRTKDQYGANGESLTLIVPVWTLIRDLEWNLLAQLLQDEQKVIMLKWGIWWKWNIHFKDSVNQFPNFALFGEPSQKKEVILELQLLADVALIGSPSVGKSSLINSISHTKAKVADYPFTTLIPNLWSINVENYNFNMIDIPGLIKWAAEWKWLGNAFLRHVLKARIFCFVADLSRFDLWIEEISDLFFEIREYIKNKIDPNVKFRFLDDENCITMQVIKDEQVIMNKKIIFTINKYDLVYDDEIVEEYKKQFLRNLNIFLRNEFDFEIESQSFESNCFVVSAASHFGLEDWKKWLLNILKKTKNIDYFIDIKNTETSTLDEIEMIADITDQEKNMLIEKGYLDEIDSEFIGIWEINDPEVSRLVFITPWWNDEWERWFWNEMESKWFIDEFENNWISKWDVLKIKSYYSWHDDRYILY